MKAFAISTFLFLLAAKLNAAPTSTARQFEAQLTFEGAPPEVAFYTLSAPTDGSVFQICTYPAPHLPLLSPPHHLVSPFPSQTPQTSFPRRDRYHAGLNLKTPRRRPPERLPHPLRRRGDLHFVRC